MLKLEFRVVIRNFIRIFCNSISTFKFHISIITPSWQWKKTYPSGTGVFLLYLCRPAISYRPVNTMPPYIPDDWNALGSLLLPIMRRVLFSKFRYVAFVTEHRGKLWKYIILLIYKTNFGSPYLMLSCARHVVTTKPSGLTQRYCLHLQLRTRPL